VSSFGRSGKSGEVAGTKTSHLHAKYLDYCSARVAGALLALTPDEMYVLAEESGVGSPSAPARSPLTYDEIVRRATERITERVALPTFEEFLAQYERDPGAVEAQLLGFWRSEGGIDPQSPPSF
jgi:hypothetical protein